MTHGGMMTTAAPPSTVELEEIDAFWRAANYLAAGQIYLLDNPLLREPLQPQHIKPRLLGHWGTTPGLTLIYAHLCRVIRQRSLDMMYVFGPGHGGPGVFASTWLDGCLGEVYPTMVRDEAGMRELMRQFSFPGGLPSHMGAETPGSIHEGGELGYALSHAFGAAFDNPDLVVACVIGDGEAETGPLAASWQSTGFVDPVRDGAVLPILHLNGYKISNPTIWARRSDDELDDFLRGHNLVPHFVAGDDPYTVHVALARALDDAVTDISRIQHRARSGEPIERPRWPVIVLDTPKGWTGPREIDGLPVEGTWRSHQVPIADPREDPQRLAALESWLQAYRPEDLFDEHGRPVPKVTRWLPRGESRLGATPHANGGRMVRDLALPEPEEYAVDVANPGHPEVSPTQVLACYLTDVFELNRHHANFRLFGPDETESNKLDGVYEATSKTWVNDIRPDDVHLGKDGRVMEILSEHTLQGWLEGYLLTGRHGLFASYEAFVHIVDSMFNQHAKWLKVSQELDWREPIPSLNYLLTSHCWRQDHNGFSHQDPGFIDHVANKNPDVIRVYLPPDANTLLCVTDRCLRSRGRVNVVVVGKHEEPTWLPIRDAAEHCERGIGIWDWASTDTGDQPDVVLACAGDIPTTETLAAADLLRTHLPDLRVRVVNVVDLMRLLPEPDHPHGLRDDEFDDLFTTDRPIVFAHHGYPWLIHRLTYRRTNHPNLHVRGYKEEGATTTPFDMRMLNDLDRYHLVMDVIDRVPGLVDRAADVRRLMVEKRSQARAWTREYGDDIPEVREWSWPR